MGVPTGMNGQRLRGNHTTLGCIDFTSKVELVLVEDFLCSLLKIPPSARIIQRESKSIANRYV